MHRHTRDRPLTCTYEGCNRSFCDRGELTQHEESHESKTLHEFSYESCNQTSNKPFQLHRHHHEEHVKTVTSGEEFRPIRLRLSQPKRKSPEPLEDSSRKRLLIRLPMRKSLRGKSTLDLMEAHNHCVESKNLVKPPANRTGKQNAPHGAPPSNSSSKLSSTSETNRRYQVSSNGLKFILKAVPHIPTPNVRPQAPASQPTIKTRSAEYKNTRPCTDGKPPGHGTSVYTSVCGVYSSEKASPVKLKTNGGPHHCPRCDTQFTRARGIIRHFPGCINKHGNPDSLKWTDQLSLQGTLKFYARNGHQGQEDGYLPQAPDVHENQRKSCELPKGALLRSLTRRPLSSVVEENRGSVQTVHKPLGRGALLRGKEIVRPIHKRRDALRRSTYNPETIARDVLLAMGSHPYMDPLNAHLDVLRKKFRAVNLESNVGTFRWDLIDPEPEPEPEPEQEQEPEQHHEQEHEQEPEPEPEPEHEQEHEQKPERQHARQPEDKVEPRQSAPNPSEAKEHTERPEFNGAQWYYNTPSSVTSQFLMKPSALYRVQFGVFLPEMTHFGPMSTIFSSVFHRDPSAKLMPSNGDLWAAIFTMLEGCYHEPSFLIRTAIRKYSGDVIGWVACHEVDTPQAKSVYPPAYLDWTTAAHLLPPQISRFTVVDENTEENAERSNQRKVGQSLASTILVSIH